LVCVAEGEVWLAEVVVGLDDAVPGLELSAFPMPNATTNTRTKITAVAIFPTP